MPFHITVSRKCKNITKYYSVIFFNFVIEERKTIIELEIEQHLKQLVKWNHNEYI